MTNGFEAIRLWAGSVLAMCAITGLVHAQDVVEQPPNTQLPQQLIPTGAEDAPASRAAQRSVTASDAQKLQSDLVRMTSESDAGLVAEPQSNGGVRVVLDDRFMSVLVATPASDGGNEISCHTGHDALDAVQRSQQITAGVMPAPVRTHASPAPAAEEK